MNRRTLVWSIVLGVPLTVFAIWVARNTYWADVTVPMPPRGEAATNPYYAVQKFVERLGARATRERTFTLPPSGGVVMLSTWNWSLSGRRRAALERWVEGGGRLVVGDSVAGAEEFARWSGIDFALRREFLGGARRQDDVPEGRCFRFSEERPDGRPRPFDRPHWLCYSDRVTALQTSRAVEWALSEARLGRQALRVRVGRGSVTAINGEPFQYRELFEGDHAWLLTAATQLRSGDDVRILSEAEYPSLLALMWQTGAPVVVLALTVLGLVLWRNAVRSGPMGAEEPPVRRSLAEQIRGTGRFALHHDGGEPLHAAAARAVDEAARRRITGWPRLDPRGRVRALAGVAGVAPDALDAALHDSRARSPHDLRDTLTLLETVRRALIREKRTGHGLN